jgi:hypothetical protein
MFVIVKTELPAPSQVPLMVMFGAVLAGAASTGWVYPSPAQATTNKESMASRMVVFFQVLFIRVTPHKLLGGWRLHFDAKRKWFCSTLFWLFGNFRERVIYGGHAKSL